MRLRVIDVARKVNCSVSTVRKFADMGIIDCQRDLNNWRIFSDAEKTVGILKKLLAIETEGVEEEQEKASDHVR